MMKEEKELYSILRALAKDEMWLKGPMHRQLRAHIRGVVRAVREDERGKSAERGFAEYLRMFGDSKQNILRAGQIVTAIRSRK